MFVSGCGQQPAEPAPEGAAPLTTMSLDGEPTAVRELHLWPRPDAVLALQERAPAGVATLQIRRRFNA